MKKTVEIHDPLLTSAERLAQAQGRQLSDVINDALASMLNVSEETSIAAGKYQMITHGQGGLLPGVNLSSNDSILETLEKKVVR